MRFTTNRQQSQAHWGRQTGGFHSSFHCLVNGTKMQGKHSCSLCKHSQGWLLLSARGNSMLLMPNNCLFAGDSEVALRNRGNLGASSYLPQVIWKCGKDYAAIGEKSLIEWTNCKVITETFVCSELGGIFAMLEKLIAVMWRNKFLWLEE